MSTLRPRSWSLPAATAGLALLAALPLAAVVGRGLAPGAGSTWAHLADTVLPGYVANTLALIVLVGIGSGIGGTIAAWLIARRRFPGCAWLEWSLLLPLAMPAYVMAYAYTDFLDYAGPLQTSLRATFGWSHDDYALPDIRSVGGAAFVFVFALYPYVYLLARTAFQERPATLVEAARSLGRSRWAAFWQVELPLARPAIAGGVALALMETLADFGTVAYFAVDTFTTGIYRAWFSLGDRTAAAQLASVLLAFVVAATALEAGARRAGRTHAGPRLARVTGVPLPSLTGLRAWLATIACLLPVLLGFVVPTALLLRLAVHEPVLDTMGRALTWAGNSVSVAGVAAGLAVVLAVSVAYAVRIAPGPAARLGARVLALGYAVPGTVLAVGLLLPLGAADALLADAARASGLTAPGLLLSGTAFALVYAYLVRFFAVAWNGIEPGLARITPAMDEAARSLGAGSGRTLLAVHAPLLRRSAAAALLLVFVDVMKELPATLILRPFNFDTLATQAFQLARDERLAEAAVPSLAIVAVGLLPIIVLARTARRA